MSRKRNKGYTIVEMLVTIAVFAMVAGMAITWGQAGMQRAHYVTAVNQFVADYYHARQVAARKNLYTSIRFDFENQLYQIFIQSEEQSPAGNYLLEPNGDVVWDPTPIKIVTPLDGKKFFDENSVEDFFISPTGVVRPFPSNIKTSNPTDIILNIYAADNVGTDGHTLLAFKRRLIIFPSGGLKIERTEKDEKK